MKNIAVLLRKEGKTETKLYNDVKEYDVKGGRVNVAKLEVNMLTPRQKAQLKNMKLSKESQDAINAALQNSKAVETVQKPGRGAERY